MPVGRTQSMYNVPSIGYQAASHRLHLTSHHRRLRWEQASSPHAHTHSLSLRVSLTHPPAAAWWTGLSSTARSIQVVAGWRARLDLDRPAARIFTLFPCSTVPAAHPSAGLAVRITRRTRLSSNLDSAILHESGEMIGVSSKNQYSRYHKHQVWVLHHHQSEDPERVRARESPR